MDELLAEARGGLERMRPDAALAALTDGAPLVDIWPLEQRIVEGGVPAAIIIGRNVLERSDLHAAFLYGGNRRRTGMCANAGHVGSYSNAAECHPARSG